MKSIEPYYFSSAFAAFSLAIILIVGFNTSVADTYNYDRSAMYVLSTSPSGGETDVAHNISIEIQLSKEMDNLPKNDITFFLMNDNESVPGTFSFDQNKWVFTPDTNLKAETRYTAVLSIPVDYINNGINYDNPYEYSDNSAKTWSFTSVDNR